MLSYSLNMNTIQDLCDYLDRLAPLRLAQEWDNVGLLVGDACGSAERVMTCLTITPESAGEAISRHADLIVTHHPLPFRPLKRITTDHTASRLLWELIRKGISIYSAHTAFDSAVDGINQRLASALGLTDIRPLVPIIGDPDGLGAGRFGKVSDNPSLSDFVGLVKRQFDLTGLQVVGKLEQRVNRAAVSCGSGGSFLEAARLAGCDVMVAGEASFHTGLEAAARGVSLVLLGHFASERFALVHLATELGRHFPSLDVWASEKESDPIMWV
jgi:dinuclear metal center YbgI/SA1388 family protein